MTPFLIAQATKVLTVGELSRQVKALMEQGFPSVWVGGEVSNLSRPASGHIYLCLKDKESQIRAVVWRTQALRVQWPLKEGMEIIARGRLTVYVPRGEYQLQVEELQPKG